MDTANQIDRALCAMRRRLSLIMFFRHSARAALFFFGLLVLMRALVWWRGDSRPDPSSLPYMLSWPLILGVIGGAILTALRRPSLTQTAAILDARGNTRDRLLSAHQFSARPSPTEMQQLAVQEAAQWLKGQDLRLLARIAFPRELRWIVVPLLTLALLWWHETDRAAERDAAVQVARENAGSTLRALETMAQQVQERAKETGDDVLRRVSERLKQSAAQLRAEADQAGDTETAALREIAELEQLVKQLRQPQSATPDELNALAQALAQHEATKEAAQAMQENRFSDAAKALENAAVTPEAKDAQTALLNAIEHLARKNEQASKQIEQLQQQQQQGGGEERAQLLQQLAQMLREMPTPANDGKEPGDKEEQEGKQAGGKEQKEGKQMTDEDLKKLLSALQQLKDQQQQEEQPGEEDGEAGGQPGEKSEEGSGAVTMLSFQPSPQGKPTGSLATPSGVPGSEKDTGTTKDPFGADGGEAEEGRRQEQSKGQLAEGESLSALVPSASAGESKATRRYKELTEAAAAAAEDAVMQEDIPLGARFLIKRYFEAIRARE